MLSGLAWTALVMGLAGGPHCAGMCAAACGGMYRLAGGSHWANALKFQAGRLCGYALAGALSAYAVQNLAWLTGQTTALRPVWTLFHGAVMVWGVMLLIFARQPVWADGLGQRVWSGLQRRMTRPSQPHEPSRRHGLMAVGVSWALMPCGLLYSALLVASLSSSPLGGAWVMAMFAAGSSLGLAAGPWLWLRLQSSKAPRRQALGMRVAGASLTAVAAWALLHTLDPRVLVYCRSLVAGI